MEALYQKLPGTLAPQSHCKGVEGQPAQPETPTKVQPGMAWQLSDPCVAQ